MQRQQAQQILEQALSYRRAEHLELFLSGSESANTRFANNVITQNTSQKDVELSVTAAFGQRVGSASTNRLDTQALRDVVARAEQIAQAAEPDTEYLPPVEPSEYANINAYDELTAAVSAQERAEVVQQSAALCEGKSLTMAGHFTAGTGYYAIANSQGVFGYHRSTSADYTSSVMSGNSSGWAESSGHALSQVRPLQVTQTAADKALLGREPRGIEPGTYTVVLEPDAVGNFLSYLFFSMDAKAAHEGRSAFTDKEGTKLGVDGLNIYSDPANSECPSFPFFGNGMPTRRLDWIRNGVLENLAYNRYWAQHTGHAYTGGATNFLMDGSDASTDDLIATVDRGLLVTRFWYIRFVDPMKLLLTGMTRDGLFWIENGQIQYGVRNLRFNESPLEVLRNIEMFGKPQCTQGDSLIPPLKVANFRFTSGTSF